MAVSSSGPGKTRDGIVVVVVTHLLLIGMVLFGGVLLNGSRHIAAQGAHPLFSGLMVLFGLFVGGFGLERLHFLHFRAAAEGRRTARIMARHPGQPWMLDRRWATRRLVDHKIGEVIFHWVFCAGWCGLIAFIVHENGILTRPPLLERAWGELALGAVFALITLMALRWSVLVTVGWLRTGPGVLHLETLPGVIGGELEVRFEARLPRRLARPLTVELRCMQEHASSVRTSGNRRPVMRGAVPYHETLEIDPAGIVREGGLITVPLRFAIPEGLPESGTEDGVHTSWRLCLWTDERMDGFALFRFVVPVFLPR